MTEESLRELIGSWENLPVTVQYISEHPEYLEMLFDLSEEDLRHGWRACWLINKIHDRNPAILAPFILRAVNHLLTTSDRSKKRELLRLLAEFPIPAERAVEMLDYCMRHFTSSAEPIAIRVHAMQILFNISELEPDLKPELAELISQEMEFHPSAGIQSRGSKLVAKLRKQINTGAARR